MTSLFSSLNSVFTTKILFATYLIACLLSFGKASQMTQFDEKLKDAIKFFFSWQIKKIFKF